MQSDSPIYLAIDLGASSGRVMAGIVSERMIHLEEVERFRTRGSQVDGSWHWDVTDIYNNVVDGLKQAASRYPSRVCGIAVDTWGVDYGLLDCSGKLLVNPYMYRDSRTDGMMERIQTIVPSETIYAETGIQFMFFNSINQLFAEKNSAASRLTAASDLLFLPDLMSYWLCGEKIQERSIASTSQLLNPISGHWSDVLIDALGFPSHLFGDITEPGTRIGSLLPDVQKATGLGSVPVFAVAGHDTGSAVAGAPLSENAPAFLSSGTWSLMGVESRQALVNSQTFAAGCSNEAGVQGTFHLLKNICGMWLVEQLREEWLLDGQNYGFDELINLVEASEPFRSIVDPDAALFARPGRMSERIRSYCRDHDEPIPQTHGQLLRTVFDSLACKYRIVFDQLASLAAQPWFESLDAGRQLIKRSFDSKSFLPTDSDAWRAPVHRLKQMIDFDKTWPNS